MTLYQSRRGFTLIELLVVIAIIALLAAILFPVFARARENARKSSCANNMKQVGVALQQYTQDYDEMLPYDYWAQNDGGNSQSDGTAANRPPFSQFRWPSRMFAYIKSRQVFQCPSSRRGSGVTVPDTDLFSYWSAGAMFARPGAQPVAIADINRPSEAVTLYDDLNGERRDHLIFRPFYNNNNSNRYNGGVTSGGSFSANRTPMHLDAVNVLYGDGHVKSQKLDVLYKHACPGFTNYGIASGTSCGTP